MTDTLTQKLESGAKLSFDELAALTPTQLSRYLDSEQDEQEHQEFMSGDDIDFEAMADDLGLSLEQVSA
jgi:hypothetical protein